MGFSVLSAQGVSGVSALWLPQNKWSRYEENCLKTMFQSATHPNVDVTKSLQRKIPLSRACGSKAGWAPHVLASPQDKAHLSQVWCTGSGRAGQGNGTFLDPDTSWSGVLTHVELLQWGQSSPLNNKLQPVSSQEVAAQPYPLWKVNLKSWKASSAPGACFRADLDSLLLRCHPVVAAVCI